LPTGSSRLFRAEIFNLDCSIAIYHGQEDGSERLTETMIRSTLFHDLLLHLAQSIPQMDIAWLIFIQFCFFEVFKVPWFGGFLW
jgi:hypothetical protein